MQKRFYKKPEYNIVKLRKRVESNKWETLWFKFSNKIFTKDLFETRFNKFWIKIKDNLNDNNHMYILFRIKYISGDLLSIGKLQRINMNDKNWYIDYIIQNMEFKSEYYNETAIESVIFSYGFKDGTISDKNIVNPNLKNMEFNKMKLPISMIMEQLSMKIEVYLIFKTHLIK